MSGLIIEFEQEEIVKMGNFCNDLNIPNFLFLNVRPVLISILVLSILKNLDCFSFSRKNYRYQYVLVVFRKL